MFERFDKEKACACQAGVRLVTASPRRNHIATKQKMTRIFSFSPLGKKCANDSILFSILAHYTPSPIMDPSVGRLSSATWSLCMPAAAHTRQFSSRRQMCLVAIGTPPAVASRYRTNLSLSSYHNPIILIQPLTLYLYIIGRRRLLQACCQEGRYFQWRV